MSLPRNPDDLCGLRAALWIRESTRGQFDRYGPETQRRLIAAAMARLGLVNTGIEFSVARSGSTVYLHKTMREARTERGHGAPLPGRGRTRTVGSVSPLAQRIGRRPS